MRWMSFFGLALVLTSASTGAPVPRGAGDQKAEQDEVVAAVDEARVGLLDLQASMITAEGKEFVSLKGYTTSLMRKIKNQRALLGILERENERVGPKGETKEAIKKALSEARAQLEVASKALAEFPDVETIAKIGRTLAKESPFSKLDEQLGRKPPVIVEEKE